MLHLALRGTARCLSMLALAQRCPRSVRPTGSLYWLSCPQTWLARVLFWLLHSDFVGPSVDPIGLAGPSWLPSGLVLLLRRGGLLGPSRPSARMLLQRLRGLKQEGFLLLLGVRHQGGGGLGGLIWLAAAQHQRGGPLGGLIWLAAARLHGCEQRWGHLPGVTPCS